MALLIGLGGYAFSGKDTVADHLVTDYGFLKTYMSKPLESALLRVNPWVHVTKHNWAPGEHPEEAIGTMEWLRYESLHKMVGYDYSKKCLDVREYLQKLGTEVGRDMFGPDVWVDYGFGEVDRLMGEGFDVAMTGIRFWNELNAIRARRGVAVWVNRPGYAPVNSHASDNTLHMENFDVCIHNVGTFGDLYDATRIVVEGMTRANLVQVAEDLEAILS